MNEISNKQLKLMEQHIAEKIAITLIDGKGRIGPGHIKNKIKNYIRECVLEDLRKKEHINNKEIEILFNRLAILEERIKLLEE